MAASSTDLASRSTSGRGRHSSIKKSKSFCMLFGGISLLLQLCTMCQLAAGSPTDSSSWVWKGDRKSYPGEGSHLPLTSHNNHRQGHAIRVTDPSQQVLQTVPSHQNAVPFPPYNQDRCYCKPLATRCSVTISSEVGCGNGQLLCCDGQQEASIAPSYSDGKGSQALPQYQPSILGSQASGGLAGLSLLSGTGNSQGLQQQLQLQQLLLQQQKDKLLQLQSLQGLQQHQGLQQGFRPALAGQYPGAGLGGLGQQGGLLGIHQQHQQNSLQQQLLQQQQQQQQQYLQQQGQYPLGVGLQGSQLQGLSGAVGQQYPGLGAGIPLGYNGIGGLQLPGLGIHPGHQQLLLGGGPGQQLHPGLIGGGRPLQGFSGLPGVGLGGGQAGFGGFPQGNGFPGGQFQGGQFPGGQFQGGQFQSGQFPGGFGHGGQPGFGQQGGFGGSPFSTESESHGAGGSGRPGGGRPDPFAINSQHSGSGGGGLLGSLLNGGHGGGGGSNIMTELLNNFAGGGGGGGGGQIGLSSLLGGGGLGGGGGGGGLLGALLGPGGGGGILGRSAVNSRFPGPFPLARTAGAAGVGLEAEALKSDGNGKTAAGSKSNPQSSDRTKN